ncbi:MAG: hypothetical protein Q8O67_13960 [Deltaproteobacteria bacterium]|nr:hypothetical protein [Deltaproteobacteria bacterium]
MRLVCCALLAIVVATPGAAAPARVQYVGGGAAFLDRGARDGLAVGAVIDFTRRGRSAGTCTVDAVADHSARCAFADKRVVAGPGDRISYERVDPVDTVSSEEGRPGPPARVADAELARARAEVTAAASPKVVYAKSRKRAGVVVGNRFEVGARARSWVVFGGSDSAFVRPSVDVGVRGGLGFLPGLYASSSLRVQGDVLAPAGERFRNSVPAELYVWDAALGLAPGRGVMGSIGRFRPQKAPGMTVIDGALLGFVGFGGALEVGAYGGLLPDLITTAPSFDRVAAGAYFGVDAAPIKGLLLLPRARVGFLTSSDLRKTRAEAEAQLQTLFTNALAIGASVRLALPGDTAAVVVDAARIDVDAAPISSLRVRAGWRLIGDQPGDLDTGVVADQTLVPAVRAAQHGDLALQWTTTEWLVLGGSGAVAIDDESGLVRGSVGPEVGLPQLFGDVGGLSLGAYEEPGSTWGRSAFVQTNTRPLPGLSWATRLSYFEHEAAFSGGDKLDGALREAMLMTWVSAPVLPWLSLRGRVQSLFDIVDVDGFGAFPVGLLLDVGVSGTL